MYRAGQTLRDIADHYGRSVEHVRQKLIGAGVEMRDARSPRASRITDAKRQAILAVWAEGGMSQRGMIRKARTSGETFRRVLAEAGIDPKAESRQTEEQVRALRASGVAAADIAGQVGRAASTVHRILRTWPAFPGPREFTPEWACRLYREGATIEQLIRWYHVSGERIREALENDGIEVLPKGRHKLDLDVDQMRQMREQGGMTYSAIGHRFGVCSATVRNRLKQPAEG